MDINHAFGKVLKSLRKSAGISQEKLALECELDRTFIGLLERGERQPSLTTLFKLSHYLEVKPSQMVSQVERALGKGFSGGTS